MTLWSKGLKFLALPGRKKLLLAEAFFFLGWARVLKALPFSRIAPSLGVPMKETPFTCDPRQVALSKQISVALDTMSRYTPWESRCLVTAIAGMRMLERRKLASTLYLGTARDESGRLAAHAWLRSGPIYLTGTEGIGSYTVVGVFGNNPMQGREGDSASFHSPEARRERRWPR